MVRMMLDDVGAVPPLPVSCTGMLGWAGSLLAIVSVPVCVPALVGPKVTVAVALAPAATVRLAGDAENGALVLKLVTLSVAVPLFEIVKVAVWLCPTGTLPKGRVVGGSTEICGAAGAFPRGLY